MSASEAYISFWSVFLSSSFPPSYVMYKIEHSGSRILWLEKVYIILVIVAAKYAINISHIEVTFRRWQTVIIDADRYRAN